jgi:hypothetical protein
MAFVFETRSESEKVNLTCEDTYPWKPENFTPWWTIDHERDIFMLAIGGAGPENMISYAISIKGEVLRFYATARSVAINGDQMNSLLDWWVYDIKLPASLENRRDEVLQLIEEAKAVEKSGSIYMRDGIKLVTTYFTKPPASMGQF